METYLIEVPHANNKKDCLNAMRIFLESGSHFLANAEWGCVDGEHKAIMIVQLDNKSQAKQLLPPLYRPEAKITRLNKFSMNDIEESLKYHKEEKRRSH
jgi:hypothetical protein